MASIAELVEGLEILSKTAKIPKGLAEKGETDRRTAQVGGADHDIVYGPELETEPSAEDIERLEELGWHQSSEADDCWSRFV